MKYETVDVIEVETKINVTTGSLKSTNGKIKWEGLFSGYYVTHKMEEMHSNILFHSRVIKANNNELCFQVAREERILNVLITEK